MTNTLVCRSVMSDMGVRSGDGGDGRTIYGLSVPFDVEIDVYDWWDGEYKESFARGAFAKTIAERGDKVKFLGQHDRRNNFPLGRATTLREDAAGLYSEFKVSKTDRGDEVLELVRDGALDSLSIGFIPVTDSRTMGEDRTLRVTRTEVSLREVSAVTFAAYDGTATIDGVRSGTADPLAALSAVEDALRSGRPVPPAALAVLDALRSSGGQDEATGDEPAAELVVDVEAAGRAARRARDVERARVLALVSGRR